MKVRNRYANNARMYHLGISMYGVGSPKKLKNGKYSPYQLKNGRKCLPANTDIHKLLKKSSTVIPRIINLSNVRKDLETKGIMIPM